MDWNTEGDDDADILMESAKVPGGKIYRATLRSRSWNRTLQSDDLTDLSVSICFVPDVGLIPKKS